MSCANDCKGRVEILDADALGQDENLGARDFAVRVNPSSRGSAYCRVTTRGDEVSVVLKLLRDGAVVATAPESDGR